MTWGSLATPRYLPSERHKFRKEGHGNATTPPPGIHRDRLLWEQEVAWAIKILMLLLVTKVFVTGLANCGGVLVHLV